MQIYAKYKGTDHWEEFSFPIEKRSFNRLWSWRNSDTDIFKKFCQISVRVGQFQHHDYWEFINAFMPTVESPWFIHSPLTNSNPNGIWTDHDVTFTNDGDAMLFKMKVHGIASRLEVFEFTSPTYSA
jgi:hypothetical protein